jgi:hypothetical protein
MTDRLLLAIVSLALGYVFGAMTWDLVGLTVEGWRRRWGTPVVTPIGLPQCMRCQLPVEPGEYEHATLADCRLQVERVITMVEEEHDALCARLVRLEGMARNG